MILPLTSDSLLMRMNECLCIVLCPPSCKWQYQIGVSGGMAEQIVSGRHRRYVYKHIRLVAVNSNASAFVIHACVNLLPAGAKSPLHKRSLCNGCISLSNAEGLGESLRPPRKLVPDTPRTTPKQFVEEMLHRHQKPPA